MTHRSLIPCLFAGILFLFCQNPALSDPKDSPSAEPQDVSMVQMIANPEKFDGHRVRIIGFVKLEFEGNAIYLHQEDFDHGMTRNGLWLNISEDIRTRSKEFDGHYCLIEGKFNAGAKGHLGMFSGSIEDINRFQIWH